MPSFVREDMPQAAANTKYHLINMLIEAIIRTTLIRMFNGTQKVKAI